MINIIFDNEPFQDQWIFFISGFTMAYITNFFPGFDVVAANDDGDSSLNINLFATSLFP